MAIFSPSFSAPSSWAKWSQVVSEVDAELSLFDGQPIADDPAVDIVRVPYMNFLLGTWIRHTMWWPELHPRFFRKGTVVPNAPTNVPRLIVGRALSNAFQ